MPAATATNTDYDIRVAEDQLTATVRVDPGSAINANQLIAQLKRAGIQFIDEVAILTAASGRAQPPPVTAASRARELLSTTKGGHERDVPCGQLDEPVGRALIALAGEVGTTKYEREVVALRLAERAGRCAGLYPLVGAALNELSNVLLGVGDFEAAFHSSRKLLHAIVPAVP